MLNRRRLALFAAILALPSAARAVTAPVVQLSPAASGPITFASAAIGGGSSTVTAQLQINQSGPVIITAPASAGGHVEFTVGTVTGCTANGTTTVPAGTTCTVPITFTPFYPGQRSVPLAVTLNGQVYSFGFTGLGTGPQARLDTTNITTFAGVYGTTSATTYTYKTGVPLNPPASINTATNAGSGSIIYEPEGIAVDSLNNVFIADYGHDLVRVAYQAASPQLACLIITENPTDFGLAANANTCAGATSQPVIGDLYTLAGVGGASAYNGDNQIASSAQLGASGVQVDAAGNIFLGDNSNFRVRVIYQGGANIACLIQIENPTTFGVTGGSCATATSLPTPGFIYTIAGTGTSNWSGDGGLATSATIYVPSDTAVDDDGDVFMVNYISSASPSLGGRIRVIYNGGALAAQLITVENPTVITPVVGNIYTVAGNSTTEGGDGNLATSTSVGALSLWSVRVDAYDNVYFSDKTYGSATSGSATGTSRIRVVYNGTTNTPNPLANLIAIENPTTVANAAAVKPGYIYTIAGETGTSTPAGGATGSGAGFVDGVLATAQQFAGVFGIALDSAGDILCADRFNYTVRRISATTGIINTVAGFPTAVGPSKAFTNGSAQFVSSGAVTAGVGLLIYPWPLALDSAGGIYVGEYFSTGNSVFNGRLRYISPLPSGTYPLLLPATTVGTVSGIQGFEITNIGTPGSTLSVSADLASDTFGFLSSASVPGMTECATTSTTTPQSSTITSAVNISAGQSCSFGFAGNPTNGGTNAGTAVITDNSLNASSATQSMYVSLNATGVTTVITSATSPIVAGQPTVFVATLTTAASAPVTCGTVNFYINGSSTAIPATLDAVLGTATITTSNVIAPSTTISTVYAGSTSGASCSNAAFTASSTSTTFTVSQTIVTLTASNTTPNLNQSITLAATVTSPLSNGPFTGTITFLDGKSTLTSVVVNSSGVATFTTSSLAAGTHSLTASYAGDPNYVSANTLTAVTVVVTAPTFTAILTSSAGIAIPQGQNGTATYSITSVGGYSGIITVTCATPVPPEVGCLYQPSSFTFTGINSTQNSTVIITTQQVSAQARHSRTTLFAWVLPGVFLVLAGFGRRNARIWQRGLLAAIGALVLLVGVSGCGGSDVTAASYGIYNVNVTFTDGTTTQVVPVTISVMGHSSS